MTKEEKVRLIAEKVMGWHLEHRSHSHDSLLNGDVWCDSEGEVQALVEIGGPYESDDDLMMVWDKMAETHDLWLMFVEGKWCAVAQKREGMVEHAEVSTITSRKEAMIEVMVMAAQEKRPPECPDATEEGPIRVTPSQAGLEMNALEGSDQLHCHRQYDNKGGPLK